MKTKYLFLAALGALALTSCVNDEFVGADSSPAAEAENGAINFGFGLPNMTRAGGDIAGPESATLLGKFFYVMGTKADITTSPAIPTTSPTTVPVFDNYFVQYTANTAGTTESNTANWEYVGLNPGTAPADYPKLSAITGSQTTKYWDYSVPQYDFFAFSTGDRKPVKSLTPGDITEATQVGVTTMSSGASVSSTAYSFYIPSEEALKQVYITDITEVAKSNFGKEVQLRFKNLGSKIRIALYETVPGYAVSDVKFYQVDATNPTDLASATKVADATLISTSNIPTSGTIAVSFPHVGSTSKAVPDADYNKASVNVTAGSSKVAYHGFGELTANYVAGENVLSGSTTYLGTTLPTATFAGSKADDYYTTVFPVSSSNALTLRVDYTLTSIDGSNETIKVYGAKASVPATYTVWRPNYAYTYIFKISDATNGWTDTEATAQGLFPITFDAVVAEPTDAVAEQTTVTTVATPSVTTYQQNHNPLKPENEYSKTTAKDIYVQVMNTAVAPAVLYTNLTDATNSFVYELSEDATEAKVLDALLMRKDAYDLTADINGRNGLVLDLPVSSYIDNTVTSIINGVDDNPITKISGSNITSGMVGKIDISALTAGKSYAYVYIQTAKTKEVNMFEPIAVVVGEKLNSTETTHKYYALTTTQVAAGTVLAVAEAPADDQVYFSVVEDGNGAKTYYYISTLGKTSIPAGSIKVAKSTVISTEKTGNDNAESQTFYFDKYITNDGKYAVKVIKIVS